MHNQNFDNPWKVLDAKQDHKLCFFLVSRLPFKAASRLHVLISGEVDEGKRKIAFYVTKAAHRERTEIYAAQQLGRNDAYN